MVRIPKSRACADEDLADRAPCTLRPTTWNVEVLIAEHGAVTPVGERVTRQGAVERDIEIEAWLGCRG